ncbi:MAG: beta-ketoacyl-ACP synthase III [Bacillota bacterium]
MNKTNTAGIISTGKALPVGKLTNFDLEKIVDTSDEWIKARTGIEERRIITGNETASGLAARAASIALERAGLSPAEIDVIIVATVTPDQTLPSTACLLQDKLGAFNASAFDLVAGCTGFLYGLDVGIRYINSGAARYILLVGVDTLSPIVDWQDRNTCVLFGDGAGAVVLGKLEEGRGVLASKMYSDGSKANLLYVPAGGSTRPATRQSVEERAHYIKMNGQEVFKFAVTVMVDSVQEVLALCGKTAADLDILAPHQANLRIINFACKRLKMQPEQVLVNIHRYGNMSSAAIPVVLDEAVEEGKLKVGHLVGLVSFGAGLTWGAAIAQW